MVESLTARSHDDWVRRAKELSPSGSALIEGERVGAASGATFPCLSARDGTLLTEVALGGGEDVERAVRSGRAAFEDGRWSHLRPRDRKRILLRLAELMSEHAGELALIESLDCGKPIRDAVAVDVPGAIACVRYFAEAADKVFGEVAPMGPDALVTVTREPLGVVGAVIPWNYPLLIASWKAAPALLTGNSLVLKPAEQAPLSSIRFAELALEAGMPPGVFNVVPGDGPLTGRALGLHPDVDKIAFTGSTEVGKLFLRYAGESNMKRVSLECGGKSPHIVLGDAPDLEAAAQAVTLSIFYNQGQTCSAGSRLIVEGSVKAELMERVLAIGRSLEPGDPLDPATELGAMIDAAQLARVLGYVEDARAEGAHVALGGEPARVGSGGSYMSPTVVDAITPAMRIAREEVFGPVLAVLEVEGPEAAVAVANDSVYGLVAGVWTRDIGTAHRMANALRAGTVWVNTFDMADVALPFGGFKQTGGGVDKSLHALDGYTQLKTTWIDISR